MKSGNKILLTGATGFVGRSLWPALARQGYQVRSMTRDVESARRKFPQQEWVLGDMSHSETLAPALQGCQAAYYLVHSMAEGDPDFRRREALAAERFAQAARDAGLERIVYLGGVAPADKPSEHLLSRLEVGQTLRQGCVPTIELRASMIIGYGSLSWLIVRDLAARLPFMILPRWLKSLTEPIGIDDVVAALLAALEVPVSGGQWFDIPGPEVLSCQQILVGLGSDLLSQNHTYWTRIGHLNCCSFDEAARRALEAERSMPADISGIWRGVEDGVRRWRGGGGVA